MHAITSPIILAGLFLTGAIIVWVAGIWVARTTTAIDRRLGFGQALGGLVILAVVTNLPEIAITGSAAFSKNVDLAVGNILGGIGVQTLVLVLLDAVAGRRKPKPLSTVAAAPPLKLEGLLLILLLLLLIIGSLLPRSFTVHGFDPIAIIIVASWLVGVRIISEKKKRHVREHHGHPRPMHHRIVNLHFMHIVAIFLMAAVATLAGGVLLEISGDGLAKHFGIDGIFFGSTILAAATALPEISTGIASVRMKEYQLAMSDIFGGNAFLPLLLLPAGIIAGVPLLSDLPSSELFLVVTGLLLTICYLIGMTLRAKKRYWGLGADSWFVVVAYAVSLVVLWRLS
jgi:cation:H+ antiporter